MNILMTIVVCAFGAALFHLLRLSRRGVSWARPATLLCAAALILLAAGRIASSTRSSRSIALSQYGELQSVCGEYLGVILAERHPGARVAVLCAPTDGDRPNRLTRHLLSALESGGLSISLHSVEHSGAIDWSPGAGDSADSARGMEGEEERMALESSMGIPMGRLRQLLKELDGQADLVVNTVGIAFTDDLTTLPAKGEGPALVMMQLSSPDMDRLLERTILDTVVNYRNNPAAFKPDYRLPKNAGKAFNDCFVVLTAEIR